MIIGYARISTTDQNFALQLDALTNAGCEKVFKEAVSGVKVEKKELNEALKIAGSKKYGKNIHKIKDKLNLINYFGQILQSKKKKKYFSIICKLSSREWDEGDKSLKVNKK